MELEFKDVCKAVGASLTIGILFVVFLCLIGVIDGRVIQATNALTGEKVTRNALGFRHQNYLGKLVLAAFIAYWFLRFEKLNKYDLLLAVALFLVLYFVVNTKTAAFVVLLSLLFTFVLKRKNSIQWRYVLLGAFVLIQITEVVAVIVYDPSNEVLKTINGLMSTRLSAAHSMLENYAITPFGQDVEIISSIDALEAGISSATLDIGIFNILLINGVFPTALFVAGWIYLVKASLAEKSAAFFTALIMVLIAGLFENWCFSLPTCFLLAMIPILIRKRQLGSLA